MERAYSRIEIKSVDEERREIVGIASTMAVDRDGDIVDPKGVSYQLPIPLLWQHDARQPIGEVYAAKVTKQGIEIKARIAKVDEPAGLQARLQEAWQSIKTGLVRGLSIGFKIDDFEWMEDTYGRKINKWQWLELSAVTIPANSEASIIAIKTAAAQGGFEKKTRVSVSTQVKINKQRKNTDMKIKDEMKKFRMELNEKSSKLKELVKKSENQTLDAADKEEFDTLADEVKEIEAHLARLDIVAKLEDGESVKTAKAVKGEDEDDGKKSRSTVTVKHVTEDMPGIGIARMMKCRARAKLTQSSVENVAKSLYPDDARLHAEIKAANNILNTSTQYYGRELVQAGGLYGDFAEYLRPQTIVGKFGTGNIPALRRVPFRVPLISQTQGATAYGVLEKTPKPTTDMRFDTTSLTPKKIATIAVCTKELVMDSSPAADGVIRDDLAKAIITKEDALFINPLNSGAGGDPAGIAYNITPIPASGTGTAADIRADLAALLTAYIQANNAPTTGVIIMKASTAMRLSLLRNSLGVREFPDINMNGGFLEGIPVITSEAVTADSQGENIVMVNASDIYFGDEGVTIDLSEEASVDMENPPVNPTSASAVMVSLWQHNLVGFRAEKRVNWLRRRTASVQYISDANWASV